MTTTTSATRARSRAPRCRSDLVVMAALMVLLSAAPTALALGDVTLLPSLLCPEFASRRSLPPMWCECARALVARNGTVVRNGLYNLKSNRPCRPCPDGSVCLGGWHKPHAQDGHFVNAACPVVATPCARKGAASVCKGGRNNACREGHEGSMCSTCSEGFGRATDSFWCQPCAPAWKQGAMWTASTAYKVFKILSVVFVGLDADERMKPETTQVMKVVLNYYATSSMVLSNGREDWPTSLSVLGGGDPGSSQANSFECWLPPIEHKAIFSWALQLVGPVIAIVFSMLYVFLRAYKITKGVVDGAAAAAAASDAGAARKSKLLRLTSKRHSFINERGNVVPRFEARDAVRNFTLKVLPRVVMVTSYLLWPALCRTMLSAFFCTQYPRALVSGCNDASSHAMASETAWLWNYDQSVECYTGVHLRLLGYVLLPTAVVAGFPLICWAILSRNRAKVLHDDRFDYTFGFLYRDYEAKYYYWETVALLRTLAITVVDLKFASRRSDVLSLLMLAIVFVAALAHFSCLPYVSDLVDKVRDCVRASERACVCIRSFIQFTDTACFRWSRSLSLACLPSSWLACGFIWTTKRASASRRAWVLPCSALTPWPYRTAASATCIASSWGW